MAQGPNNAMRRAAVLVRIVGGLQLLAFGCAGSAMAGLASLSDQKVQAWVQDGRVTGEQVQQLDRMRGAGGAWAIAAVTLGVAPAAVYLALSFGVRRGRPIATMLAMLLAGTQAVVLAVVTLNGLAAAVRVGSPPAFTAVALTLGTMLGLVGYTVRSLWSVFSGPTINGRSPPGSGGA